MGKSMKKLLLLAKVQAGAGVDPVPTAALNAILCRAFTPTPINVDQVDRGLVRAFKGNSGKLTASAHREFEFEVELAGAGAAGTAPPYGVLLKGCDMTETVTAATDVKYAMAADSNAVPYLTLYGYLDGLLFKMTDARGTVSFALNAKGIPIMRFRFLGEYSIPTDTAIPGGVDYSKFVQPLTIGRINTPLFTFMGATVCTSGFEFDIANALEYRDLINCGGAASNDRSPTGNATFELTSAAVKNWAESVRTGEKGAVAFTHGSVAGNIVQVAMPSIQPTDITIQDEGSVAMVNVPFDILPVSGNDELVLTVK